MNSTTEYCLTVGVVIRRTVGILILLVKGNGCQHSQPFGQPGCTLAKLALILDSSKLWKWDELPCEWPKCNRQIVGSIPGRCIVGQRPWASCSHQCASVYQAV